MGQRPGRGPGRPRRAGHVVQGGRAGRPTLRARAPMLAAERPEEPPASATVAPPVLLEARARVRIRSRTVDVHPPLAPTPTARPSGHPSCPGPEDRPPCPAGRADWARPEPRDPGSRYRGASGVSAANAIPAAPG